VKDRHKKLRELGVFPVVFFDNKNHGKRHGDDWGTVIALFEMQFINIAFVKALDQASHRLSAALACAGRSEVKTDMHLPPDIQHDVILHPTAFAMLCLLHVKNLLKVRIKLL